MLLMIRAFSRPAASAPSPRPRSILIMKSDLQLAASIANNVRWAKASADDRHAQGVRGQVGLLERFEREVDPDNVMDPATRAKCAENARKAHMQRMALASLKARRAKAEARRAAKKAES